MPETTTGQDAAPAPTVAHVGAVPHVQQPATAIAQTGAVVTASDAEQAAIAALKNAEQAAVQQGAAQASTLNATAIDAVISQWETDCVHNSPASRDTAGFNHLQTTAIPELRRRLKGTN